MRKLAIAALLLASASYAEANDSMAELKAGGLSFVTSDAVSMEEEDLFISADEVRVKYRFHNNSDADIATLTAFPMPDLEGGNDMPPPIADTEKDNFMGFSVVQDGQSIEPKLQQRAMVNGVDLSDTLLQWNVPLLPFAESTRKALANLNDAQSREAQSLGLIRIDSYDAGNGWQSEAIPLWTLQTTYWWNTTYPAKSDITVEHRYRPGVGGTVSTIYLQDGKPEGPVFDDYVKRYCINDFFIKLAQKNLRAEMEGTGTRYYEHWISYILKTGNNWFGPIKSFTLTVDKGAKENFVSFCGEGVKKIAPTQFQVKYTDFYPDRDFDLLLIKPVEW